MRNLISACRTLFGTALASTTLAVLSSLVPATSAQAQMVVKFATTLPETSAQYQNALLPWAEAVNKDANGEFVIKLFDPTFATTTNVADRVESGVAEMGVLVVPATGLPLHRSMVTSLPMVGGDGAAGSVALWRLFEQGLLGEEYAQFKVLYMSVLSSNTIVSRRELRTLEDMAGLKVRANDKNAADALAALGASPVFVSPTDVYQGLSTGLVDAAISNPGTIQAFRYLELAPQHLTNVTFGSVPIVIVMNKDFYDGLSATAKAVLDRHSGEAASAQVGGWLAASDDDTLEKFKTDPRYQPHELSADELKKWSDLMAPVQANWLETTPDGAAVLEAFQREYQAALSAQ